MYVYASASLDWLLVLLGRTLIRVYSQFGSRNEELEAFFQKETLT